MQVEITHTEPCGCEWTLAYDVDLEFESAELVHALHRKFGNSSEMLSRLSDDEELSRKALDQAREIVRETDTEGRANAAEG